MKIKMPLFFGIRRRFFIIALLFIAAFIVSYVKNTIISGMVSIGSPMYTSITNYRFALEDAASLHMNLTSLNTAFLKLANQTDPSQLEKQIYSLDDYRTGIIGVIAQLQDTATKKDNDLHDIINKLSSAWEIYNNAGDENVVSLLMDKKYIDAQQYEAGTHASMFNDVLKASTNLSEILTKKVNRLENDAVKLLMKSRIIDAVITLSILVVVIIFLFYSGVKIITPISKAVMILKDIAQGEGDLTKRLTVESNDEIGELAGHFNCFANKLQNIISEISKSITTLTSSSEQLAKVSVNLAKTSEESRTQADMVANASVEASSNVNNISKSAKKMSKGVQAAAAMVEEISLSLNSVADNCQTEVEIVANANKQTKETQVLMKHLNDSSQEIGNVIKFISNIASQTNLLALNATIEAANAGSAGKGFSVVAKEVKELAKQTSYATEQIKVKIEEMQNSTFRAVDAILEIARIVENVNSISQMNMTSIEQQSATVNEIANNFSSTSLAATEIAHNVGESAKGLKEISNNIQGVSSSSLETTEGIDNIKLHSQELAKLSSSLYQIVKQFEI